MNDKTFDTISACSTNPAVFVLWPFLNPCWCLPVRSTLFFFSLLTHLGVRVVRGWWNCFEFCWLVWKGKCPYSRITFVMYLRPTHSGNHGYGLQGPMSSWALNVALSAGSCFPGISSLAQVKLGLVLRNYFFWNMLLADILWICFLSSYLLWGLVPPPGRDTSG